MSGTRRIAVLGLYNSGSSAVAGMLHRLGVHMGPPFWVNSDDASPENHYEPYDLSWHLRRWWDEPALREAVPAVERTAFLQRWIALQETSGTLAVGAKHPLLSLCGPEILQAWGPDTLFIWCSRPLQESVDGLVRRGWFGGRAEAMQRQLWSALEQFERDQPSLVRLQWDDVLADPACAAIQLAAWAQTDPSPERIRDAADFVASVEATPQTRRWHTRWSQRQRQR